MKVEGSHAFHVDRELVWNLLNDPNVLARCIPGCEKLEPAGNDTYTTTLNVGLAAIKGSYQATVSLQELAPPSHYRMVVEGRGPQGFVRGSGSIDLEGAEHQAVLRYSGDVQLGGTLAGIGQRMLQGAAKMMLGQFFTAIEAEAAARDRAAKSGEALDPPKHGLFRDFFRYLWGSLKRIFSGVEPNARSK